VMHTCDPSTREAEAGGWWDLGQHGLRGKTLSQKTKAWDVAQWQTACLVCARPWVPSLALKKTKEKPELNPDSDKTETEWFIWFFFGGDGTRVWTQGLILASQVLYHLSHSASPVLCWIFSR
jgi:hypothetical protein